jgi:hypothetical protein
MSLVGNDKLFYQHTKSTIASTEDKLIVSIDVGAEVPKNVVEGVYVL